MQNIREHQVIGQMNRHPILTKPNPHGYDQTAPGSHCHPMPTTRCTCMLGNFGGAIMGAKYRFAIKFLTKGAGTPNIKNQVSN